MPSYNGPCFQAFAAYILRTDVIRIGLEATFNTKELALAATIFFGTTTASKTRS